MPVDAARLRDLVDRRREGLVVACVAGLLRQPQPRRRVARVEGRPAPGTERAAGARRGRSRSRAGFERGRVDGRILRLRGDPHEVVERGRCIDVGQGAQLEESTGRSNAIVAGGRQRGDQLRGRRSPRVRRDLARAVRIVGTRVDHADAADVRLARGEGRLSDVAGRGMDGERGFAGRRRGQAAVRRCVAGNGARRHGAGRRGWRCYQQGDQAAHGQRDGDSQAARDVAGASRPCMPLPGTELRPNPFRHPVRLSSCRRLLAASRGTPPDSTAEKGTRSVTGLVPGRQGTTQAG